MPGVRDWCVLRLAAVADGIEELKIDTHFFRGNVIAVTPPTHPPRMHAHKSPRTRDRRDGANPPTSPHACLLTAGRL